ncbi:hypothetical protein [Flavobacterium sp.]|uniref:hypothetical protein n=1 Tax=Flavobacterium sp. TaxID=239 RepID=UPI00404757B4
MKNTLLILFLAISEFVFSQISTYEFVKINNDYKNETIYYYEYNWKIFREKALKQKHITSYELVVNEKNVNPNFDIILITTFKDSLALSKAEEVFQKIIKETRPNGPILLNDIKPKEFKTNIFVYTFKTKFNSTTKRKRKINN